MKQKNLMDYCRMPPGQARPGPGQISVNLWDLTTDTVFARYLVAPVTPGKIVVWHDTDRADSQAVILECDRDRALAIRDVARLKHSKNKMRFYEGRTRI